MRAESGETATAETPRIEVYVAPWALPGEEIPVLAQWSPESAISSMRLSIPEGFAVVSTENVATSSGGDGNLNITGLKRPGFAAVYLKSNRVPPEVLRRAELPIEFITQVASRIHRNERLTVVRPMLEFIGEGHELVLGGKEEGQDAEREPLRLRLRHTGLGVVSLQIKCRFRGTIISQNQDIIRGIVQRVIELLPSQEMSQLGRPDPEVARKAADAGLEVEIDPLERNSVEIIYRQVMDLITGGALPPDMTSEVGLGDIKAAFANIDMDAFNELIRGQIYTLYTRYLLDGIRRYPSAFSEIQGGPAGVRVDSVTNEIHVEVRYTDSQGNEYGPITTQVSVRDNREHHRPVVLPVRVDIETELLTGLMG